MSEAEPHASSAPPPKQDPEALVLRGRPRPVIRFRKGLIIGLSGAVSTALITLTWVSLRAATFRFVARQESSEPAAKTTPEAIANAPLSYGDIPKLGPPLPGDLGRAILDQQRKKSGEAGGPVENAHDAERMKVDEERQRRATEQQAAQTSPVLFQLTRDSHGLPASAESQPAPAASPVDQSPIPASAGPQQHKLDFARSGEGSMNPHGVTAPASTSALSAGTIIPAGLVTGLNSDLPGMVIAQVTENVRDSGTGKTVLIPQGSRLIGRYDSAVSYGQRRALIVWNRIVFPDGTSIELEKMPATDSSGYAGLQDRANSHPWQLLKGVVLSSLLGLGSELSFGGNDIARAISQSTQQSGTRVGEQIVGRALDVQPTLTVRPGWRVEVIVDKDLVLQPWRG